MWFADKANSKTADSKYDARLWAFGQLTGITDSHAQSLVEKGADDGSDVLAMSLAARGGLADYIIDLLALFYAGNHGGINEDMGDGKRGDDGWLPAAHVRKALQAHFETVAPPSELPGASGFTSKQGWESPYGNTTLHVRGIPKDCEGEEELAAAFRPFGRYVQGTVRQRSASVVDGVEVVALSWALVTFLDEASMENALAAQAKSPLVVGADQTELSCQKVDAEKAASSTGSFGKTWRKGKAKAGSEVERLLALDALVHIPSIRCTSLSLCPCASLCLCARLTCVSICRVTPWWTPTCLRDGRSPPALGRSPSWSCLRTSTIWRSPVPRPSPAAAARPRPRRGARWRRRRCCRLMRCSHWSSAACSPRRCEGRGGHGRCRGVHERSAI